MAMDVHTEYHGDCLSQLMRLHSVTYSPKKAIM